LERRRLQAFAHPEAVPGVHLQAFAGSEMASLRVAERRTACLDRAGRDVALLAAR